MVKLLGAFLVLLAGTLAGFYQSRQLNERPAQIRRFIHAFKQLETEILYGFTPLPQALQKLSARSGEPVAAFFEAAAQKLLVSDGGSVREAWVDCVEQFLPRTALKANEKDVILQLGWTLGISDREDQIKHLQLAASELQAEESAAVEEQRRYGKMWKSLGVLMGALVVIMMY